MILQSAQAILIEVQYAYIGICQRIILSWTIQKNNCKSNIKSINQFKTIICKGQN